jgi:hypothetical protein
LLARFLYALPASNLGRRTGETRPLSEDLKLRWEGRLHAILNAEPATDRNGEPCPHALKLSAEALAAWKAFWRKIETDMGPGGKFEHCTDWAGKFPGAAARIAGLLHVARNAFRGPETLDIALDEIGPRHDLEPEAVRPAAECERFEPIFVETPEAEHVEAARRELCRLLTGAESARFPNNMR